MKKHNILIVDLNNFARYPTLAIGYLIEPLRRAGFHVSLLSPLSFGAKTAEREAQETWQEHIKRRVYFSTQPIMLKLHDKLRALYAKKMAKPQSVTTNAVTEFLAENPVDIILLSAYLNHYPSVKVIAELAQKAGIPVLLGGKVFNYLLSSNVSDFGALVDSPLSLKYAQPIMPQMKAIVNTDKIII